MYHFAGVTRGDTAALCHPHIALYNLFAAALPVFLRWADTLPYDIPCCQPSLLLPCCVYSAAKSFHEAHPTCQYAHDAQVRDAYTTSHINCTVLLSPVPPCVHSVVRPVHPLCCMRFLHVCCLLGVSRHGGGREGIPSPERQQGNRPAPQQCSHFTELFVTCS